MVTVPMTQQTHCIKTNGDRKLLVADTSDSTQFRIVRIRKKENDTTTREEEELPEEEESLNEEESPEEEESYEGDECSSEEARLATTAKITLNVGQWVVVMYEGTEFPGEVVTCGDNEVEVSAMHRSGNSWKWPKIPDKIFYSLENISRLISAPTVVGSRGQFTFNGIL